MHLWDIDHPDSRITLQSPHQVNLLCFHLQTTGVNYSNKYIHNKDSLVLDVVLTNDYILVLRSTHLEFYSLPYQPPADGPSNPSSISPSTLHPLFVYQWQWRIDNAGMTIRRPVPESTLRTPISIILRYGSYFPWVRTISNFIELNWDLQSRRLFLLNLFFTLYRPSTFYTTTSCCLITATFLCPPRQRIRTIYRLSSLPFFAKP